MTIGEEIMLLSLAHHRGAARGRRPVEWCVAGGTLLELTLAGRVTLADGILAVVDPTPTGVPLLDGRLTELNGWTSRVPGRTARSWLIREQYDSVHRTVASLTALSVVREERRRVLGVFPGTRYPETDTSVREEVLSRLATTMRGGAHADVRTAGLLALLHGARLHQLAFPQGRPEDVRARMAGLAGLEEPARTAGTVRETIRGVHALMRYVTGATGFRAGSQ